MSFPESIYDEEPEDKTEDQSEDRFEIGSNDSRISQSLASKLVPQYSARRILQHAWHMYTLQQLHDMKNKKANEIETIVIDDEDEEEEKTKNPKTSLAQEPVHLLGQLLGHDGQQYKEIPISKPPQRSPSPNLPTNETPKPLPFAKDTTNLKIRPKNQWTKIHVCEHCDEKLNNLREYEKHLLSAHKNSNLLKCPICDKKFSTFKYLGIHKDFHKRNTYQCERCNFSTGFYRRFQEHQKTLCSDKCVHCEFSSSNLQLLETHGKQRSCKECTNNGFDTSFNCLKKYHEHNRVCNGQGLTDDDVKDVDVIVFKEEHCDQRKKIVRDMPIFEELTVDKIPSRQIPSLVTRQKDDVGKYTTGRIETGPGVWRSEVGRPDAKRRRIACVKTFVISNA